MRFPVTCRALAGSRRSTDQAGSRVSGKNWRDGRLDRKITLSGYRVRARGSEGPKRTGAASARRRNGMKRFEPRRSALIDSAFSMLSLGPRRRRPDPVGDGFGGDAGESRRSLLDLLNVPDSVCWPGPMAASDPCSYADYHRAVFEREFAHGVVARIFGLTPDGRRLVARRALPSFNCLAAPARDRAPLRAAQVEHSLRSHSRTKPLRLQRT